MEGWSRPGYSRDADYNRDRLERGRGGYYDTDMESELEHGAFNNKKQGYSGQIS